VASLPAGTYSYEVIAVRHSGDGQSFVESGGSAPATATVSGTPQSTTTTTPPPTTTAPTTVPAGTPSTGASSSHPTTTTGAVPRVDAGNLGSALAQARAATTTTGPRASPSTTLPFLPDATVLAPPAAGASQLANAPLLAGDGATRRRLTFEYLAGGLLLFVLAMYGLFIKRQAELAGPLEPLVPGTPAPDHRE
jgi:hypothetical protein